MPSASVQVVGVPPPTLPLEDELAELVDDAALVDEAALVDDAVPVDDAPVDALEELLGPPLHALPHELV